LLRDSLKRIGIVTDDFTIKRKHASEQSNEIIRTLFDTIDWLDEISIQQSEMNIEIATEKEIPFMDLLKINKILPIIKLGATGSKYSLTTIIMDIKSIYDSYYTEDGQLKTNSRKTWT
jgi:hypothetical protein